MEAATPLRAASVRTVGDRLVVDGLIVQDECAVRLVHEREEAGEDAAKAVVDAIEIGARVLDREQAGANADFVRSEFDKVSREVEAAFTERAREAGEQLEKQMDKVFGPESGHLTKALEKHFSDESSGAVQNRVKDVITEVMTRSREDLLRQFSSADGQNPLADFKAGTLRALGEAGERQDKNLTALTEQLSALKVELQALRDEKQKLEEVDAERERGTAKGRVFEEAVAEALEAIAAAQGDDCDAVGDLTGATGKTGDVIVHLDACRGPARGRIVFEAKNRRPSKPDAMRELDRALEERDADFAVMVFSSEEKLPAKTRALREYNGDKLLVAWDPDEDTPLALEIAYSLARARVLMTRADEGEVDSAAIRDAADRALAVMEGTKAIKSELTGATNRIGKASTLIETMESTVRQQLREIDALAAAGAAREGEPPGAEASAPAAAAEGDAVYVDPAQTSLV
ncbi:MAG: hypothetical protein QOE06_2197 [Thermoleophilaceae bacterium]|jgi:hypothetical protein|nr:hypothetical protein [Thermoleophilaceae bacterium]